MINQLDLDGILAHLCDQVEADNVKITAHAQQEMLEDQLSLEDIYRAIQTGQIIENYPDHQRGACCLLYGNNDHEEPVHVVCTTVNAVLILITVYRPELPKWITPVQRNV